MVCHDDEGDLFDYGGRWADRRRVFPIGLPTAFQINLC
jgi:hypothetical protein